MCACVMTLGFFFFFFAQRFKVWSHMCWQPVNSLERTKIQQFVAEVDLGGKVDGKHSKTYSRSLTHSYIHTHTHKINESSESM